MLAFGVGLLLLGLLLVPDLDGFEVDGSGTQSFAYRGYLSSACSLLGIGLVLAAAVLSALLRGQRSAPPADPGIDHYS